MSRISYPGRASFPHHRFADTDCPRSFHRGFFRRSPRDLNQKIKRRKGPVNPGATPYPKLPLPTRRTEISAEASRQYLDSPSISPRYWGAKTSHTSSLSRRDVHCYVVGYIYIEGGKVAIAAVYRGSFMTGRFTFAVPASLSLENHVHIPRGINKSSVSIRVGIQPAAVAAVIAREGAHEKRENPPPPRSRTMAGLCFPKCASSVYK